MPAEFRAFPVPRDPVDQPLVSRAGTHYTCTGCGGEIPDGVWLYEAIADGMVTGLVARVGSDGPVVHACGSLESDDG